MTWFPSKPVNSSIPQIIRSLDTVVEAKAPIFDAFSIGPEDKSRWRTPVLDSCHQALIHLSIIVVLPIPRFDIQCRRNAVGKGDRPPFV